MRWGRNRVELQVAVQVRANKGACFDGDNCFAHVEALVGGLIASASNELLCLTLVEATAALVAEPESQNTPEVVQKCAHFLC